jgi:hypothetical protein
MQYELSDEEKLEVVKKRLNALNLNVTRSGSNLTLFNMDNGEINLSIFDEVNDRAYAMSLNDEALDEMYKYLKQRHELKKELDYLEKPRVTRKRGPF